MIGIKTTTGFSAHCITEVKVFPRSDSTWHALYTCNRIIDRRTTLKGLVPHFDFLFEFSVRCCSGRGNKSSDIIRVFFSSSVHSNPPPLVRRERERQDKSERVCVREKRESGGTSLYLWDSEKSLCEVREREIDKRERLCIFSPTSIFWGTQH